MRATAQVANDPPNTERGRSGGDEDDRGMNPKHPPGPPVAGQCATLNRVRKRLSKPTQHLIGHGRPR
jgi:hypothetical protein